MPQKFLLWTVALLGFYNHALGQDGPYIQMGLGIAVAPAMDVRGTDNDWGYQVRPNHQSGWLGSDR